VDVAIRRIAAEHVEGFHRALDQVARERKYLAFLEAPAVGETREFVTNNIAKGYPQFVARLQPPTGLKEAERSAQGTAQHLYVLFPFRSAPFSPDRDQCNVTESDRLRSDPSRHY
jgi:hypothetical protein